MFHIPPLPSWPNIHPLIVHLPIGAFLLAPLLMLIGLFPLRAVGFRWAALVLLVCGSFGCFLAVESGEAASEAGEVGMIDGADRVVSEHEELAEQTMAVLISVTATYAGILITQHFWKKSQRLAPHLAAHGLVLIATCIGLVMIANVGHLGGRLVHQYGVHAKFAGDDMMPKEADHPSTHDND